MATERKPDFFQGKGIKIGIVGCGYVGLPLALRFAEVGQIVMGFDTDEICRTLQITSNNCYVQLHRARLALRALRPTSRSR